MSLMDWRLDEEPKRIWRGIVFMLLILLFGYLIYNYIHLKNESTRIITTLKKEIIKKDTTIKIIEGKYSKLVNTYATKGELNAIANKDFKVLADTIKKRKETILSITSLDMGFKSKSGTKTNMISNNKGDTTFTFESYYPDKINYMTKFTGNINMNTKKVAENWEFSKFKIGVILTEREDGLWDSYIDAPEYAVISNMKINSLPPSTFVKKSPIGFWGGLGVRTNINKFKSLSDKDLILKVGLSIKDKFMITGDVSTDNNFGVGVIVKL